MDDLTASLRRIPPGTHQPSRQQLLTELESDPHAAGSHFRRHTGLANQAHQPLPRRMDRGRRLPQVPALAAVHLLLPRSRRHQLPLYVCRSTGRGAELRLRRRMFMLYRYSSELEEGHHHNGTADYSFSLLCMGALILLLNKPLGSTPFLFEPLFIAIIYQWVRSQPCSRSDQASTLARHKQTRRSRSICSVSFLCKSATARQASLMVPQ
jgi:hypothetical protein